MNLFYFKDHHGNFGDAINDWLWDALIPNRISHASDVWLSGIGTILNHKMPAGRRWVVMGSGAGYGAAPVGFGGAQWDVAAVRGPLSAMVLGLDRDEAITDGAMLLSLLPGHAPGGSGVTRQGIVFMPHYMSVTGSAWREACDLAGIEFIDPCDDTHSIIARLRKARLVIADAMHAAIVADTLRTPWIAASLNGTTDSFKWNDWCSSMDLVHAPYSLPPSTLYDAVRNRALPFFGELMLVPGVDAEGLCGRHAQNARAERSVLNHFRRKVTKRLTREVATVIDHVGRRFAPAAGRRQIEAAAEALTKLSTTTPVLSKDVVFDRQRERMAGALVSLARRYGLSLSEDLVL